MASTHVEMMKLMIAYTLVGAFIFTVIVTCLSLVGWVKFADKRQQSKLFGALILELVVICLGSFTSLLQLNPADARAAVEAPLQSELTAQELVTREVTDRMNTAAMEGLQPEAQRLARELVGRARRQGIEIRISSGYRSLSQQRVLHELSRSGRSGAYAARFSVHNTGLAFDIVVVTEGRPEFEDRTAQMDALRQVGRIGGELGLVWGDRQREPWHFETGDAQAALRRLRAGGT